MSGRSTAQLTHILPHFVLNDTHQIPYGGARKFGWGVSFRRGQSWGAAVQRDAVYLVLEHLSEASGYTDAVDYVQRNWHPRVGKRTIRRWVDSYHQYGCVPAERATKKQRQTTLTTTRAAHTVTALSPSCGECLLMGAGSATSSEYEGRVISEEVVGMTCAELRHDHSKGNIGRDNGTR